MRVPSIGPKIKEKNERLARLRSTLIELEKIPAHRREDECADIREKAVRKAIEEIETGFTPVDPVDDLDELLKDDRRYNRLQKK